MDCLFISLLIGISNILMYSSYNIWIILVINIILIICLWLISYFSIKDCKDKNVWKWGLGSSALETIFLGVTGQMLFSKIQEKLS